MIAPIEPYVFSQAVRDFWHTRERQADEQKQRGMTDQGTRSSVTGGQQMNGFVQTMIDRMMASGVDRGSIFTQRRISDLPGYYRPAKDWDIVVIEHNQLLAVIELKSQIGPSFGNNFNNRTEEAMGSALDLWTAYREGAFQTSTAPWLGYLLLLEDCPASRRPVGVRESHYPVFEEFRGSSYARRYELFCRKLVRERQYSAACFLMADRHKADLPENYSEPAEDLGAALFLSQLLRQVARR